MINTILYMAASANGLINGRSGETPWSDAEWIKYSQTLQRVGCLIVGATTHEVMSNHSEYDRLGIKRVIVLTKKDLNLPSGITASNSPENSLAQLEQEGFSEVVIGGGAATNATFLKLGLVNQIILDIEPILFGRGLPLFSSSEFDIKLELLEAKPYSQNAIGLRYKVLT